MRIRRTPSEVVFDAIIYVIVGLISIACLLPFTHTLFASISKPEGVLSHVGLYWFPDGFFLRGYQIVLQNPEIWTGYLNTINYVVAGTLICLFVTTLAAYALSHRLLFARLIMLLIIFTMMFSGGLIPFYNMMVNDLHLQNTMWAVVLPGALSAYYMIIIRTSFGGIPQSLEESAKIDGANYFSILARIYLPLSKATLAVIALYCIVAQWNAYFWAMIFLRDRLKYPLQLFLREILIQNDTSKMVTAANVDYSQMDKYRPLVRFCVTIVATLPIICLYPFLQKYFVKGIMVGSIKG